MKRQVILFALRSSDDLTNLSIRVGDNIIFSVTCVRNLGVSMERGLTMESHITSVTKAYFAQLRCIDQVQIKVPKPRCNTVPCPRARHIEAILLQCPSVWTTSQLAQETTTRLEYYCQDCVPYTPKSPYNMYNACSHQAAL